MILTHSPALFVFFYIFEHMKETVTLWKTLVVLDKSETDEMVSDLQKAKGKSTGVDPHNLCHSGNSLNSRNFLLSTFSDAKLELLKIQRAMTPTAHQQCMLMGQ